MLLQDGNTDLKGLKAAVDKARSVTDKPSFIKVSTLIGYGSPNKANTHGVHGSPLGEQRLPITALRSLGGVLLGQQSPFVMHDVRQGDADAVQEPPRAQQPAA